MPRKTADFAARAQKLGMASMRPRPDAAENQVGNVTLPPLSRGLQ